MEEDVITTPVSDSTTALVLDDELSNLLTRYLQKEMQEGDYSPDPAAEATVIPATDFLHKPFNDYTVTEGCCIVLLILLAVFVVYFSFTGGRR